MTYVRHNYVHCLYQNGLMTFQALTFMVPKLYSSAVLLSLNVRKDLRPHTTLTVELRESSSVELRVPGQISNG